MKDNYINNKPIKFNLHWGGKCLGGKISGGIMYGGKMFGGRLSGGRISGGKPSLYGSNILTAL